MASTILLKNPSGVIYAYENVSYWDRESKTTKHKRKCVGHIDPITNEIVTNHKKANNEITMEKKTCIVKGSGISLLLDRIASEIGLTPIMQHVFPEDWQQIMTCAYFLVSDGSALCHVEKWSENNFSPYGIALPSQRISELLTRISLSRQYEFFAEWINANRNDEYYALDITSVSSYSELVNFVRYGYNRDGEELPQINMLMVSGERSNMPLYFRLLPGSIKDVNTLCETLDTLELIDVKRLHLVMDKGFYSQSNIDALYETRTKFMIGVPFTVGFAKEQVQKARAEDIMSHENYRIIFEDEVFVKSSTMKWNGHRCYVHVYFDSLKAELEYKKFNRLLYKCYEELLSGKTCKSHDNYYKKYFRVKETPKRGRRVEYVQSAIDDYRNNTVGWFVMITNDVKEPIKALEIYRRKDTVEKSFDDLKNDLDCKRLRIHTAEAMDGRLFIQYIALILTSKIRLILGEAGWFKNYDMQQVIDEMKSIREVKLDGSRKKLYSTPTAFQAKIIELFGLSL